MMPFNYYPYYQQQQPQQQQQQPQAIQNGGFVFVRSAQEAFNYPVAPGNSVTFKDECAPFVYTKTQGFSQLDRPIFKRFRLVEETQEQAEQESIKYALKSDLDKINDAIAEINDVIAGIKAERVAADDVQQQQRV